MYTVKNGNEFILKLSGLDIEITAKEYTMINNIIKRTLAKYEDCKQEYIGGRITSYCVTHGCFNCLYKKYCKEIGGELFRTYYREYDKYIIYNHLLHIFNINDDERKDINVLWNNTMEELLHYTEGES